MWSLWWVWVVAGFAIAIIEVAVPGYIFLGFALGAIFTGGLLGLNLASANLTVLFLIFAVASVTAWLVLRAIFGFREGQVKRWKTDINDN